LGVFEDDVEAVERQLHRLGGGPQKSRKAGCSGSGLEDGDEVLEDPAMLLQIEADRQMRARIALKKAQQEAAATAADKCSVESGDGSDNIASSCSNSDENSASDWDCSDGGVGDAGRQRIQTFPIEESNRVPSNRIHRPKDDSPYPEGGDSAGLLHTQFPAPGLFSSLDEDAGGGGTGEGTEWGHRGHVDGDQDGEARSVPFPTQVGQAGMAWVLEEELVRARQLPPVRWTEGRADERTLAEIGRSQPPLSLSPGPSPPSTTHSNNSLAWRHCDCLASCPAAGPSCMAVALDG
jgi:hypothetical protein